MKANSDPEFARFKNADFAAAKPVAKTPHLRKLQAQAGGKSRVTMRVDSDVVAIFRARAQVSGGNYQTMINDALREYVQGRHLAEVVREAVRDSLKAA